VLGSQAHKNLTFGSSHYVGPADFATIYNIRPLYDTGLTGVGTTIAIASQSSVDPATAPVYWSAFGVTRTANVTYVAPFGDPGLTSAQVESNLDVEIAGALAPGAKVMLVTSGDVGASAQWAIDLNEAAVLSISYGLCEAALGAGNVYFLNAYQQAAAQGITVLVSSGD
jgi:subtilase family serine protease